MFISLIVSQCQALHAFYFTLSLRVAIGPATANSFRKILLWTREKGCVRFGNDDVVAKEPERKKVFFFFFYLTKRNGSTSISTPTFSSGSFDSGLHRIRQQYKHRTDVPTSERQ
jgi:hypothetical protein